MPMPSLFRYFAVVGSALLGVLLFINYLVEPDTVPAPRVAAAKIVVEHDPNASVIERWRDDQAAMKTAQRGEPVQAAVPQRALVPLIDPTPMQPEPAQIVAPAALTSPALETEATRAQELAQRRAMQARKARIARERAVRIARAQEMKRHQQQDYAAAYAPAPQPTFNPFGWNRD